VRDNVGELAYLVGDVKPGLPLSMGDEHARMNVLLAQSATSAVLPVMTPRHDRRE
jgi:hypothetical protein